MDGHSTPRPEPTSQDADVVRRANDAVLANDLERAIEIARAGLQAGCVHPLLLNLRAYWHEQAGRDAEAFADLARAAQLAPEDPAVQNAYGIALAKAGRYGEAVDAFGRAIEAHADFAQAHYNLGWAFEGIAALDDAAAAYRAALKLNPAYPESLARLASLAARAGRWDEARDLAGRARQIDPAQPAALDAECTTAIALKQFELAESLLSQFEAASRAVPFDRALCLARTGDLRHAQTRFAEAFKCYAEGNRLRREIFGPQFDRLGKVTAYESVRWLTQYLDTTAPQDWLPRSPRTVQPAGAPSGHVFLIGFPRSGTTLAENILACHPDVVSLEEKGTLNDAVRDFLSDDEGMRNLTRISAAEAERYRGLYWAEVLRHAPSVSGRIFVDKLPLAATRLPAIAKLFPDAKILFAIRDPRDVVLSCFRRTFQMNASMYEFLSLDRAARFYDAVMRLSEICRKTLALDWHELRHERTIEELEGRMTEVCKFIGIGWHPAMHDFAERAKERTIATPSSTQVTRGLSVEGIGQWRNYREQLAPVLPLLGTWVRRFGYQEV